ncbi:CRP/FNR family transcriptional regulator [Sinobaca qinghaiensis]|uniref:CRP/FNR family transcriptional regulator n=1 Tax=Sinobaca qinghaiensis TaxID=342944 RepID=A0A419UWZ8_9BACL|nr:Crp/Fnr family transcriptional regulator [Sinobaca qinghaiensis]RKD69673.1 CRP/FNR family transcriptional regulator [Sinobaca qinghaiensis]
MERPELLNTDCECSTTNTEKLCVSIVPIFNHLQPFQLNEIMEKVHSSSYKKGELIFQEGRQSDTLYIVHTGKVKIYRLSEGGKEHLVSLLLPGDFTGEYALFNESTHQSFAQAVADTKVCKIQRHDFQAFLTKYPAISLNMLTEFSQRLNQSENQRAHFAVENVDTRLALYLVELAQSDNYTDILELPMTRIDLASYLGTTAETISRRMADLETRGFIKQISSKRIKVLDYDGLSIV